MVGARDPGGRSFLTAALREANFVRDKSYFRRAGMLALVRL